MEVDGPVVAAPVAKRYGTLKGRASAALPVAKTPKGSVVLACPFVAERDEEKEGEEEAQRRKENTFNVRGTSNSLEFLGLCTGLCYSWAAHGCSWAAPGLLLGRSWLLLACSLACY